MQIDTSRDRPRVTAVLGPTNTGKTHFAMERMLGHASGMIGFPLRLLARENFERAVKAKGPGRVALITGEEKIVPPDARYFLCTVEAMPVNRRVDFLAIDEIQMCADPDRGHVFTHRLLHARGRQETMFMGAETVRPLLRALVPEAEIVGRPRMSVLRYAGNRKITRLPRRTAVVAFSAAEVYAIAELVRRQRGGAAVVLGALSPRTRNAQVAMYQAGEVDYLVATDAIGMGLNMDVDHVAFAQTRKFDGRFPRDLNASEMAQIAGRAGRHMNDGTFGATAEVRSLDAEMVDRIENHAFPQLRFLFWRNPDLRFTSIETLLRSLGEVPEEEGLVRAREADDEAALQALLRDESVRKHADSPESLRLLWEVAQIPDFRKLMSDAHARLLGHIYGHLTGPGAELPTDWVAGHVERLDRTGGDIETLMGRIAHIRTWTYVSHRGDWLEDAGHWQETTRAIEDRLSDALHERLTQRFVDRRTAVLLSRLKERQRLMTEVDATGQVSVEGHAVGRLEGFRYMPIEADGDAAAKAIDNAALSALRGEVGTRIKALEEAGDDAFTLTRGENGVLDGLIAWQGAPVARFAKGADILAPSIEVLPTDLLEADDRERIRLRLAKWLETHLRTKLEALFAAREATLEGAARGLAYQVTEALGSLRRHLAREQIEALGQPERKQLREVGLRFGRESIYAPALCKSGPVALRALLWSTWNGREPLAPPPDGRMSVALGNDRPRDFLDAIGYRPLGPLALRVDILERVAGMLWDLSRKGPFAIPAELLNLVGCSAEDMDGVLKTLGYVQTKSKPRPETEAAPETPPVSETTEAAGPVPETTEAAEPAAVPAEPEPPTPEPEPKAEAEPAPAESSAEEPADDGGKAEKAQEPEPVYYVFRPRRNRRPQGDRKPGERKGGPPKGKGKPDARAKGKPGKGKPRGPKKPVTLSAGPKKQEFDPDSPFAKLAQLNLKK